MQEPRKPSTQNNGAGNRYASRENRPSSSQYNRQTPSGMQTNHSSPRRPTTENDGMTPELRRLEIHHAARNKMIRKNLRNVLIILVIVCSISVFLASIAISCVNDILVIHIPEKKNTIASVVIQDGMTTDDVIDALDDAGLIKNGWFCKLAARFIGYSDDGYIPRTYEFNRSMGLENMLNEIKNNSSKTAKTVTLTFPEGYTVDQIFTMLEEAQVCSRAKLIEAMNTVDFTKDFDFLLTISNEENRYMKFEGFLFPDTYEFYLGEEPDSVLKKFLTNFGNKWSDNYADLAQKRRLSVDQVIRLASIIEKEAAEADMPVVGSILLNRLDADMRLECDSTKNYIPANKSGLTESEMQAYDALYDTYVCSGIPVGAICNPGIDAIEAVLNAPDTDYYYFIHDTNNVIHVAKSLSEQENNIATYGLAQ